MTEEPAGRTSRLTADLVALARPRLAFLGLITVLLSYVIAAPSDVVNLTFASLVAGSLLSLSGASVLNQVMERRPDALMRRTWDRPLPAGRRSVRTATVFGVALSLSGLAVLGLGVNAATAAWAAFGLGTYLALYTPLKQRTSLATVVGAVPGAVPVLLGWSAARGGMDREGWLLFGILFLWQLPHFLAIAWMYRTDYTRAGFRILSVQDPAGEALWRQAVLYALALLPVSMLPAMVGLAGPLYFFSAVALGLGYIAAGLALGRHRTGAAARKLLKVSVLYLPLLLLLMAIDRLVV